jgi:threonine synthase
VGGSQLVSSPDLAKSIGLSRLYLKDDTRLPSSSFKDRASSVLLAMASGRGIGRVCTASTGNAGCSMACLCADSGQEAFVFVPESAPAAKIAQLLFYGATVAKVQGSYDDAFDLCWRISNKYGWLNRSTGWNPFTREGKKTVSFEIAQQLNWQSPDAVFVPVGDGNIISGVYKGFSELAAIGAIERCPAIVAVQSTGSNAIARAVGRVEQGCAVTESVEAVSATTMADSISVDLPRDGVAAVRSVLESGGCAVEVTDDQIREAIVNLSRQSGIFAEPAGATAYAGLLQWIAQGRPGGYEKVVCLVTGNGLKDVSAAADLLQGAVTVPASFEEAIPLLGL